MPLTLGIWESLSHSLPGRQNRQCHQDQEQALQVPAQQTKGLRVSASDCKNHICWSIGLKDFCRDNYSFLKCFVKMRSHTFKAKLFKDDFWFLGCRLTKFAVVREFIFFSLKLLSSPNTEISMNSECSSWSVPTRVSKALGKWIVLGCNSLIQGCTLCQMKACNLLMQGLWTLILVLNVWICTFTCCNLRP